MEPYDTRGGSFRRRRWWARGSSSGQTCVRSALDPIKNLRKFVAPLPLPGSGLALAAADKTHYNQTGAQADFYRI